MENTRTSSVDMWRREMIAIGTWLAGTLEGRKVDESDNILLMELNRWLEHQREQYDTLIIGPVRCRECDTEWDALAYSSTVSFLECPECGKQDSEAVVDTTNPIGDPRRSSTRQSTSRQPEGRVDG